MSAKAPGLEKYIPTRLEWLALQLNDLFQRDDVAQDKFSNYYAPGIDGESIHVRVSYFDGVDKEIMNEWINRSKASVLTMAKLYGWSSWVKVEVDVEAIK